MVLEAISINLSDTTDWSADFVLHFMFIILGSSIPSHHVSGEVQPAAMKNALYTQHSSVIPWSPVRSGGEMRVHTHPTA